MPGRNFTSSINFPYGYQGQEKDAATGLTNFELRQYDPRISRRYNPDPYGQHHSPYLAMSNNPVSFTDPDGGWDGSGNPGNSDDIEWAARFEYMANTQNAFINGDVDSYINGQENMAMVSHAYNEYRAAHTNGNGEWGDWVNGQSARDLGDEMYSYFVADPKKKKENPVLFKLNQLNGGGLDFSGAKFNMSGYENLPWYKTKVDVFGTNAAKSAWNQAVGMTETVANTLFSSDGRKDVFAGVDNLVKGTMNWIFTASTDQKVDDILDAGTDVHNYENLAGGIGLGYGMTRFGGIGVDPKILKPKPPGCFIKGTKVWADSGLVNIEDVKAGDLVFAYDIKNEKTVVRKVTKSYIRVVNQLIKLKYGNEVIFTTSEHPFYVSNTWVEAAKLHVGDLLFLHDKSSVEINQISVIDTVVNVYNFTVGKEHNYYVGKNKILVHNNDCGQPLKNISGNLKDAANAARVQQYGSNMNVWRRLPITAQDVQALEEAQLGMGRNTNITLKDPRYLGWEKWHHSVGPKGGKSVVHYLRNPVTGQLTDFKFK